MEKVKVRKDLGRKEERTWAGRKEGRKEGKKDLGRVGCDIIHCMCEIRPRCYHGDLVSLPNWKEEHCHPVAGRAPVRAASDPSHYIVFAF